jgi:hypothetical protein
MKEAIIEGNARAKEILRKYSNDPEIKKRFMGLSPARSPRKTSAPLIGTPG